MEACRISVIAMNELEDRSSPFDEALGRGSALAAIRVLGAGPRLPNDFNFRSPTMKAIASSDFMHFLSNARMLDIRTEGNGEPLPMGVEKGSS